MSDRDNTGSGVEQVYLRFYDGANTLLFEGGITYSVGSLWSFNVGYSASWTTPPAYNPLRAVLVSVAGYGWDEQTFDLGTGQCAGLPTRGGAEVPVEEEPVPGCDVLIAIPSTAVGGTFTANSELYWAPGEMIAPPIVMWPGKSVRVIGLDASGAYYKILYGCTFAWARAETLGPNFDPPWNGLPLPTAVVK